jgi:uncharacterized membrane protein YhaH (DUF805 family)
MYWYTKVLSQYADFDGRARRKEYWMFVLFNVLFSFLAALMDSFLGLYSYQLGMGLLGGLYVLAIMIPGMAVTVRRLHDTGRSGWMILIALIPIIGPIWLFILMLLEGQPHENKYGPDPKQSEEERDMDITKHLVQ